MFKKYPFKNIYLLFIFTLNNKYMKGVFKIPPYNISMSKIFETLDKHYIKFETFKINVIIDNDGDIWFNANEISISLGYKNPKKAITKNIGKKDKIQLKNINMDIIIKKHPHSIYISESGLYSLMLSSRLKKTKKFKTWITSNVLPSIRKYGFYKLKEQHKKEIGNIMNKINYLQKQNNKMKNDLKKEKFPDGGVVYVIDYSDENDNIFRIGMTSNMNKRKKIYDTHTLYKKKVKFIHETKYPIQFETCLKSMLYNFRYKNKKDFYITDLKNIQKAFKICVKSFDNMNQIGGGRNIIDVELSNLKSILQKSNKTFIDNSKKFL